MFRTVASLLAVGQGIKLEARCNLQTKSKLGGGEVEVIDGRCVNVSNDKADSIDSRSSPLGTRVTTLKVQKLQLL